LETLKWNFESSEIALALSWKQFLSQRSFEEIQGGRARALPKITTFFSQAAQNIFQQQLAKRRGNAEKKAGISGMNGAHEVSMTAVRWHCNETRGRRASAFSPGHESGVYVRGVYQGELRRSDR
jgi:hypothetical protein